MTSEFVVASRTVHPMKKEAQWLTMAALMAALVAITVPNPQFPGAFGDVHSLAVPLTALLCKVSSLSIIAYT